MNEPQNEQEWVEQFRKEIAANRIMVYAKGEKNAAVCGFSHRVMEILNRRGVDYAVRDILRDENILPALESFTQWPTSPQIFIDARFIGGCDILTEMDESGELSKLLGQ